MKKSDLKNGMMVETRDGNLFLVVGEFMTRENSYDLLSNYNEDMINVNDSAYGIVKVYEYKNNLLNNNAASIRILFDKTYLTLLWEREEHKLTEREIEILKALQTLGHEWLARDLNGELFAFGDKPKKMTRVWITEFNRAAYIDKHLFTFIKWEDEEPTKIKELLK
jgi:hypothetical protein